MTRTTGPLHLVVVSAGLGVPSSTRLLADRLTESVRRELAGDGRPVEVRVVELRDLAVPIANNLVTGFPARSTRRSRLWPGRTPSSRSRRCSWPRTAVCSSPSST